MKNQAGNLYSLLDIRKNSPKDPEVIAYPWVFNDSKKASVTSAERVLLKISRR